MNKISEAVNMQNCDIQILAIPYVPMQNADFSNTFCLEEALIKGTIFPELYLPFCAERGAR